MSAKELFPNVKTFLLDCDGLLWYNYQVINNANVSVKSLRNHGYNVYFVTNTTLKNSVEILEKLHHLRFEACQDEIFCPSLVMAHHLKSLNFQKSVYVIGYRSIISELNLVGINGYDDDDLIKIESTNPGTEIEIGAVIIGHDISYKDRKVHRAIKYLQCPETLYLSSGVHYGSNHIDPPVSTVGKTVEMIKESCCRMPELFAKPSSIMWDFILKRLNLDPETTCMVGDSVICDIAFGNRHNLKTVLAMSGETSADDLQTWKTFYESKHEFYVKNHGIPDLIVPSFSDLVKQLTE